MDMRFVGVHCIKLTAVFPSVQIKDGIIQWFNIYIFEAVRNIRVGWEEHTYPVFRRAINNMNSANISIVIYRQTWDGFQYINPVV